MEPFPSHENSGAPDEQTATRELQETLNKRAEDYRLDTIAEDGAHGPHTKTLFKEVIWRMGLFPGRELSAKQEATAQALLAQPRKRDAEQLGRDRRRGLNVGAPVDGAHHLAGVQLLRLTGDFAQWVHRRVETHSFDPLDPAVFIRRKSIDFTLPADAVSKLVEASGACTVPVTFVSKWRLISFDVRDEAGAAVPLLARDQHVPLSAAMLIALAYKARGEKLPPASSEVIPLEIEEDLRAIVSEEPATALGICDQLGDRAMGTDTPATEAEAVMRWRRALVTDEPFMELAYELAAQFMLMVLCPAPLGARRILKISYERPVDRPAEASLKASIRSWRDRFSLWRQGEAPLQSGGQPAIAVGQLVLSSISETLTVGAPPGIAVPVPCAVAKLVISHDQERTIRLNTIDVREEPNVPVGEYELNVRALKGFQLTSEQIVKVKITAERPARVTVHSRQVHPVRRAATTSSIPAPTLGWGPRLSRGVAWRSKSLLIRLRLGEGGGYHFEFEAPPGLQVTRAKLVAERGGELDIILRSAQRTHLYVAGSEPASGYALLNLRPRVETVVRGATFTAAIATAAVLAVALRWEITGHVGSDGIALLVGLPAFLSAYFAYAVPSAVTNNMLSGLRALVLLPGALAFVAAALVLDGDSKSWGLMALVSLLVILAGATIVLVIALRYTANPPEQQKTSKSQSPDFVKRYL